MTLLASRSLLYPDELTPPQGLRGAALALWRAAAGWAARGLDLHARILRGCPAAEAEQLANILRDRLRKRRGDLTAAEGALETIRGEGLVPFGRVYYPSACHAARAYAEAVHKILRVAVEDRAAGPAPDRTRAGADWEGGVKRAAEVLRERLPRPQNLGVRGLLARIRAEAARYQAMAQGGARV
jgi:hypothetical protein